MIRFRPLRFSPLGVSSHCPPVERDFSARSARLALGAANRGGSIATPAHGTRGGAARRLRQSTHICIQYHPSKSPNIHQLQTSNTYLHSSPSPRPSNASRRPWRLSDTRPGPFRHAGSQRRADRRNQSSGGGDVAASQRRHDRPQIGPRVGRSGRSGPGRLGRLEVFCPNSTARPSPAEPADFSSSRCVSFLVSVSLGLRAGGTRKLPRSRLRQHGGQAADAAGRRPARRAACAQEALSPRMSRGAQPWHTAAPPLRRDPALPLRAGMTTHRAGHSARRLSDNLSQDSPELPRMNVDGKLAECG